MLSLNQNIPRTTAHTLTYFGENISNMRPFYCGTQYYDWLSANCKRCKKANFICEIQEALNMACIGSGEISEPMAKRVGITEENKSLYQWPCGEVEWTEEWKAEFSAFNIKNNHG